MKAADIPTKFPIPFADAAGGSYTRPIPEASQIGIQGGAASLTDGFPPLNFTPRSAGGIPPFGEDFNGLLNQITAWSQWQNAGGTVTYDSGFSTDIGGYPKGAILASTTAGRFWMSLVDDNTDNPDVTPTNWALFAQKPTPLSYPVNITNPTGWGAALSQAVTGADQFLMNFSAFGQINNANGTTIQQALTVTVRDGNSGGAVLAGPYICAGANDMVPYPYSGAMAIPVGSFIVPKPPSGTYWVGIVNTAPGGGSFSWTNTCFGGTISRFS